MNCINEYSYNYVKKCCYIVFMLVMVGSWGWAQRPLLEVLEEEPYPHDLLDPSAPLTMPPKKQVPLSSESAAKRGFRILPGILGMPADGFAPGERLELRLHIKAPLNQEFREALVALYFRTNPDQDPGLLLARQNISLDPGVTTREVTLAVDIPEDGSIGNGYLHFSIIPTEGDSVFPTEGISAKPSHQRLFRLETHPGKSGIPRLKMGGE